MGKGEMMVTIPIRRDSGISTNKIATLIYSDLGPLCTIIASHGGIAQPKTFYLKEREKESTDRMIERKEIENMDDKEIQEKIQTGELAVRHLTARECWRLMDLCERTGDVTDEKGELIRSEFDDSNFEKAKEQCSESQLYKQAGNSICVGVLEAIFENIFCDAPRVTVQATLDV